MFTDEVLERLFARKELQEFTMHQQSMIIDAFEEVLEEVEEQYKNATIPES